MEINFLIKVLDFLFASIASIASERGGAFADIYKI